MKLNPEKRTMLPRVAFTGFAARYKEPTLQEGFQDITKVEFKVRMGCSVWTIVLDLI
jgi:bifunctional polynucleotide phosphatase/kinase